DASTAWITDGGRRGSQGIQGGAIEGQSVLAYLREQNVTKLVITCSHPHEDHMGGLVDIVKGEEVKSFHSVLFVDSGIPPDDSLYALYKRTHGEANAANHARYESAFGRNAFAEVNVPGASVEVSNFKYTPDPGERDPHGRSIIMSYHLKGEKPLNVVD